MDARTSEYQSQTTDDEAFRIASDCTVVVLPGEHVLILGEDEAHRVSGRIYVELLNQLSVPRTACELVANLNSQFPPVEIAEAWRHLDRLRVLVRSAAAGSRFVQAFWKDATPSTISSVDLRPLTQVGVASLERVLAANGVTVCSDAEVLLVLTDDYLRPELVAIAAETRPWLLAKIIGRTIWLGPLFRAGRTACWHCLARWLRTHRWKQAALLGFDEDACPPQPSVAALPSTISLGIGMVATAATILAGTGELREFENLVVTYDTITAKLARHPIRRHPWCTHCVQMEVATAGPMELDDLASPVTGIVSQLKVTDERMAGWHHARASVVMPIPAANSRPLLEPIITYGTGWTELEAETRAISEAAERYSCTYQGREEIFCAHAHELDCIRPSELLHYSDQQYTNRTQWNLQHSQLHWVPENWDDATKINWVRVQSLDLARTKYAPAAYSYLWYQGKDEPIYCRSDSNGCASGRSRDEALLGGLLELVERDAVAIWWYNRIRRPGVHFGGDRSISELSDVFHELGRTLQLLDLTTDLGIPAYAAVAPKYNGAEPFFASAADVSPRLAATKAIRELSQILFWTAQEGQEAELSDWLKISAEEQPHLHPIRETSFGPEPSDSSVGACLELMSAALSKCGLEAYFLDMTRPEIGVPTVRAIVPGLRHCWARLGGGRLYDVPVQLGWLQSPIREEDMNPVACML